MPQSTVTTSFAPIVGDRVERLVVQPVALVDPVRDVGLNPGAKRTERLHEQRGRCHAIRVEIAVHDDLLLRGNGTPDTNHRFVHAKQPEWVAQLVRPREKRFDVIRLGNAPVEERLDQQRVEA